MSCLGNGKYPNWCENWLLTFARDKLGCVTIWSGKVTELEIQINCIFDNSGPKPSSVTGSYSDARPRRQVLSRESHAYR